MNIEPVRTLQVIKKLLLFLFLISNNCRAEVKAIPGTFIFTKGLYLERSQLRTLKSQLIANRHTLKEFKVEFLCEKKPDTSNSYGTGISCFAYAVKPHQRFGQAPKK